MSDEDKQKELAARKKSLEHNQKIASIIKPVPKPDYCVDIEVLDLKGQLERYNRDYGLDLNPDFQRGHVWKQQQQIKFIEAFIRDAIGSSAKIITFNCPEFGGNEKSKNSDLSGEMLCMDGLQRLTAMQAFVDGEFKIFQEHNGGVDLEFFNSSRYSLKNRTLRFEIFFMQKKKDVLEYYLAFNSGGTIHSESEINRVTGMLKELT